MTNMKHKSVQARSVRNGRYKAAINPIREMFSCTAAECAGKIQSVIRDNVRLVAKVDELEADVEQLNSIVNELKARLDTVTQ